MCGMWFVLFDVLFALCVVCGECVSSSDTAPRFYNNTQHTSAHRETQRTTHTQHTQHTRRCHSSARRKSLSRGLITCSHTSHTQTTHNTVIEHHTTNTTQKTHNAQNTTHNTTHTSARPERMTNTSSSITAPAG